MAVHKKESENGWFYHAPKKRQSQEQVFAPPASQIPGLSELEPQPEEIPKSSWIKETDTKYIQLCKQGGRQDLLVMRPPKSKPSEPKGYPRVDWFYLEDNRKEDEADLAKRPWEFSLPEYMVHDEYQPEGPCADDELPYRPKRLPYASNTKTIYESEKHNPSDKKVKLPELTRPGYGIRADKLDRHPPKLGKQPTKERPVVPKAHIDVENNRPRYVAMQQDKTEERPSMQKILAYSYQKEWRDDVDRYQNVQGRVMNEYNAAGQGKHPIRNNTEYTDTISKSAGRKRNSAKGSARKMPQDTSSQSNKSQTDEDKKDLFKLSRFKNVDARTDSFRNTSAGRAKVTVHA